MQYICDISQWTQSRMEKLGGWSWFFINFTKFCKIKDIVQYMPMLGMTC